MLHGMLIYQLQVKMHSLVMTEMDIVKYWKMPNLLLIQMGGIYLLLLTSGLAQLYWRLTTSQSLNVLYEECMVKRLAQFI